MDSPYSTCEKGLAAVTPPDLCPSCQTPPAPTDHFCAACGAALNTATSPTPAATQPAEPDFIPLAVTPTFDSPAPTGIRRLADRFSLPRLRHG